MDTKQIVAELQESLQQLANPVYAKKMSAYMKEKFEYLGINSKPRSIAANKVLSNYKLKLDDDLKALIYELYHLKQREYHYVAIDLCKKYAKKMDISWLPFIEQMIVDNAWWDSVDTLAAHNVGALLKNNIELQRENAYKWMDSGNLWLMRTAIIFQLSYKKDTNEELLYDMIRLNLSHKDFFIKKACGWALRQYSKTNTWSVSQFVTENKELMSKVTKTEAIKYLNTSIT